MRERRVMLMLLTNNIRFIDSKAMLKFCNQDHLMVRVHNIGFFILVILLSFFFG